MVTRALRVGEGRKFKAYEKRAAAINAIEPEMELLSDEELRSEADALRERARNGESLDDLLPEAFALTREAARRALGQRHFDVQLIGGMVLHDGAIAEMKTGEGKTLTATLAVFLNTLGGDSVHLVTVNDYLARRDAEWMKPIYDALGVSVASIQDPDDHETPHRAVVCQLRQDAARAGADQRQLDRPGAVRLLRPRPEVDVEVHAGGPDEHGAVAGRPPPLRGPEARRVHVVVGHEADLAPVELPRRGQRRGREDHRPEDRGPGAVGDRPLRTGSR